MKSNRSKLNRSLLNRSWVYLLIALLFTPNLVFAQTKSAQVGGTLPAIKFTEYKLKNGLRVILHEDHSTPIVGVNLWYHVGSKNEVQGKTGFAHLFEHMMFQGSKNYDDDYFKPIQESTRRKWRFLSSVTAKQSNPACAHSTHSARLSPSLTRKVNP